MCDVLFGGPGMCGKVWQGVEGRKLAKNSMTYFMDGPLLYADSIVLYFVDSIIITVNLGSCSHSILRHSQSDIPIKYPDVWKSMRNL